MKKSNGVKAIYGLLATAIILMVIVHCKGGQEFEPLRLGFPVNRPAVIYNVKNVPIGELDSPWLFRASDFEKAHGLVLLTRPFTPFPGITFWKEDAYVKIDQISISPPPELELTQKFKSIPVHPALLLENIEVIKLRYDRDLIELRVDIDLSGSIYFRYDE